MVCKLDITGMKFGRLTAIKQNGVDISPSRKHLKWDCVCDCGNFFNCRLNTLRSGSVKSCGCLKLESKPNLKHGLRKTPEYESWAHLKTRCLNKNSSDYYLYGGRGITICQEWENSFECFIKDMGGKPSKNMSIDRIDVNKGYEPSNCRWADNKTQSRNKRNNKFYEFNGMKMCQSDWAEFLGISVSTLIQRLKKWSLKRSLSTFKEK